MQSELAREIGDGPLGLVGVPARIPRALAALHVRIEGLDDSVIGVEKIAILGGAAQHSLRDLAQETNRVVFGGLPNLSVNTTEEAFSLAVPGPPKVIGEVREAAKPARQIEFI